MDDFLVMLIAMIIMMICRNDGDKLGKGAKKVKISGGIEEKKYFVILQNYFYTNYDIEDAW